MVSAIIKELQLKSETQSQSSIWNSLYFGGGTPSVLLPEELSKIIQTVNNNFELAKDAEITLEANPDDLSEEYISSLAEEGINRLSIGIQSFHDQDLIRLNRSHNALQASQALTNARAAGIQNVSVDLILGLPDIDENAFEYNLNQIVSLKPPHVSVYALTVEEKTALAYQVKTGEVIIPEDEVFRKQFMRTHEVLENAAYSHYELSNYALNTFESKHNSAYWKQEPYLGIGPSAHSFDGTARSWNIRNNMLYIKSLESGTLPTDNHETLTQKDRYHEYLMTQLRIAKGIDLEWVSKSFEINIPKRFPQAWSYWTSQAYLIPVDQRYRVSPEGWLMADRIISDFFLD